MADGSDGNLFDPYGLERLLEIVEEIRDKGVVLNTNKMSAPLKEVVDSLYKKVQQSVQNTGKIDPKEIKPLVDSIITTLRETGMATKDLRGYSRELRKALEDIAKKGNLDEDKLVHMFVASISNMFKSGVLDPSKKTAKDDYITKLLTAAFSDKQIKAINSVRDAILYVFGQQQGQEKTKRRQFIEDLVAGLSQSKFFGGAIMDFVKLIIYMVGSWLKDKGPLGKALTVALVAGAPVIAQAVVRALVSGLGKLFIGLGRTVVGLLKVAILSPLKSLGSKLLTAISAKMAAKTALSAGSKAITVKAAGQVATLTAVSQQDLLAKAVGGKVASATAQKAAASTGTKAVAGFVGKRLAGAAVANAIPVAGQIISIGLALWTIIDLIKMAIDWFKNRDKKKESEGHWWDNILNKSNKGNEGNGASSDVTGARSVRSSTINSTELANSGDFQGRKVTGQFRELRDYNGVTKEHQGIDLAYNQGENVGAFVGGKVVFAGMGTNANQRKGYGNVVDIQDSLGLIHRYAHLSKINVAEGQEVSAQDIIGLAGSTGGNYDPHLHYGLMNKVKKWIDPHTIEAEWYKKGLKGYKPGGKDKLGQDSVDTLSKSKVDATLGYREEYAEELSGDKTHTSQAYKKAFFSKEAITYAKKRAEEDARQKVQSKSNSIAISPTPKGAEDSEEVTGALKPFKQWEQIKKNKLKEMNQQSPTQDITVPVSVPPQDIKLDFTGTERFSKVLQNTLDAQHQSYKQY